MAGTTTYDVSRLTVLWGSRYITGFADDSELKITPNGDAVTPKTGIQGDTVYSVNPDRSATLTFSVFANASVLAELRQDARSCTPRTLTVRDPGPGGFLVQCDNCVITKIPDIDRGKEAKGVEISIYVPDFNPME